MPQGVVRLALALWITGACCASARSEVRFGRNVYIGGHDFSHQSFNRQRRAEIYLYDRQPRGTGCRWVRTATGRTKVCHLKTRR